MLRSEGVVDFVIDGLRVGRLDKGTCNSVSDSHVRFTGEPSLLNIEDDTDNSHDAVQAR